MEIIKMKDSMEFEGFYLIKSAEVKTARNGKNYLDLIVQDKTGQIGGKLWGASVKDEETYKSKKLSNILIRLRRESLIISGETLFLYCIRSMKISFTSIQQQKQTIMHLKVDSASTL